MTQNTSKDKTTVTPPDLQNKSSQPHLPMSDGSISVRFLDKLQVLRLLSISSTSLYDLMVNADFPRPRVLQADPESVLGKSYWISSEVEQWMLSRPKRVLKSDRTSGAK
ncbi:MAG: AlpA family phage regulatory protein [Chloroflexi bacterium]|nr:AlpA family phage regulatory protein [Chloroflexota bacterium]